MNIYRLFERFDMAVIRFVQGFEHPTVTQWMKGLSFIGSGTIVICLSVLVLLLLYFVFRHRLELILFIVAISGSALLNVVLKAVFHRERPNLHRLIEATGYSFPSGHSMAAFSLYSILVYLLWRHAGTPAKRIALVIGGVIMIAAIGISRIYLGVHYPSDVIGGYLFSACWVAVVIGVFEKMKMRKML